MTRAARALKVLLRGNVQDPPTWLTSLLGGAPTASGVDVTPTTALSLSTVYDCAQILAQTVGMLPMYVYEETAAHKREKAGQHPIQKLLRRRPNPEMTAYTWRALIMVHLAFWGNHYSQIVRDQIGRVLELRPLAPYRVRVMRRDATGELYYQVSPQPGYAGPPVELNADEVVHIKGLTMNGLVGLSPIGAAREALGVGLAAQEYGARFFSNDANPGGFLEHPGELEDAEYDRLKKSIEDQTRSLDKKHRMIILEEGMKWNALKLPVEDAQFLATREFQVSDIARFYRMPLYKLSQNLSTKNSNVEQLAIEFITDTIMPWLVNIEEELETKLLSDEEQGRFRILFSVKEQLRGDFKSRSEGYAVARQWGWMSVNEIRAEEGLNSIGDKGDEYIVPLNMVPAGTSAAPVDPTKGDPHADA